MEIIPMKTTHVVALRVPREMKQRLERIAEDQGVSMNQLANYLLDRDLAQIEAEISLERRLARASVGKLKQKALSVLDRLPARPTPEWDRVE